MVDRLRLFLGDEAERAYEGCGRSLLRLEAVSIGQLGSVAQLVVKRVLLTLAGRPAPFCISLDDGLACTRRIPSELRELAASGKSAPAGQA